MKRVLLLIAIFMLSACSQEDDSSLRIVSLIPSNTEIVNELVGTDYFVGISSVDNYPESLNDSDIAKIDTFNINPEEVIQLKPTHIISHESISESAKAEIDQIVEATNAELLVINDAKTLDDVFESIKQIGEFLNVSDKSDVLVEKMKDEREQLIEQYKNTDEKTAFVLITTPPDIYVAANDTFMSSVLNDINIVNVFDDLQDFPMVDVEAVVERSPEYLISATGISKEQVSHVVNDEKAFKDMPFTDENKICVPNVDEISRPGPRILSAMKDIAECVHE